MPQAGTKTRPIDGVYRLSVAGDHGRVYIPAEMRKRLFGGPDSGEVDARIEDGSLILTPVWAEDDQVEAENVPHAHGR